MKYLIIGDTHASWSSLSQHMHTVEMRGIEYDEVIQVGDFGFYQSTMGFFKTFAKKFKKKIHFIDGNHEDHAFLAKHKETYEEKYNLFYHPRGSITEINGSKIGWMGGAFNVDRPQEFINGTQNFPSREEIDAMIAKVNDIGGVDLMVTHSCPHSIGVAMKGTTFFQETIEKYIHGIGYTSGPLWDCGDEPLTTLWHGLKVKPKNWVFGHFHKQHQGRVGDTNFFCVGICDMNFKPSCPVYIYDTEYKQVWY
jgi:predicted phosphodiesterase